ncbi:hypothetical protein QBC32DRAFT_319275 [Pseudoneurospora amorphoporcata]|uniref:Uncharacterized protein n=1 Tax=Pseudoneurospora amorphoporcata TaxID=241081 RepID=A0AAN6SB13_9PEZI|nr:hypothetical protein QBC32DRAFT_319275 [Pseudoneurospora amorphoporcata]
MWQSDVPENPFALTTRGVILGRAVYVSPYRHFSDIVSQGRMREAHFKFLRMISSYPFYPTGQSAHIAFAMTITGGVLPKLIRDVGRTDRWCADNYLDFENISSMPYHTHVPDFEGIEQLKHEIQNDWYQTALKAYCERRWYVLDTDRVGLGNHRMQQGDVIAKLVGLSVPCVPRPLGNGEGYQFIGEAYCYGEMDGLAKRVSRDVDISAKRSLQKIVIM